MKSVQEINPELSKDYVTHLEYIGFLKITGPDAKKLLQGQLTCDLEKITPVLSQLGAHCNYQGRVISFFRLIKHQEQYYLQMPRVLIPQAFTALKKYAVFYKVEISDASNDLFCLGFQGDTLLQEKCCLTPKNKNEVINYQDLLIIKHDHNRYQVVGDNHQLSAFRSTLGNTPFTTETIWLVAEIRAGMPTLYPETSELFLPHELNLPTLNAVSFNKGCYTGQEIIARMHYRGKAKKTLQYIKLNDHEPPKRGADIEIHSQIVTVVDFVAINHQLELLILG